MKVRQMRINDAVAHAAANIIRTEMADPRIGTVVSIVRAEVTRDLKFCKIWVSVPGDEKQQRDAMVALGKAAGFIRHRVAETVNLRNTPEITFVYDDSIAHGMRIRQLIDEANR